MDYLLEEWYSSLQGEKYVYSLKSVVGEGGHFTSKMQWKTFLMALRNLKGRDNPLILSYVTINEHKLLSFYTFTVWVRMSWKIVSWKEWELWHPQKLFRVSWCSCSWKVAPIWISVWRDVTGTWKIASKLSKRQHRMSSCDTVVEGPVSIITRVRLTEDEVINLHHKH